MPLCHTKCQNPYRTEQKLWFDWLIIQFWSNYIWLKFLSAENFILEANWIELDQTVIFFLRNIDIIYILYTGHFKFFGLFVIY